MINQQWIVDGDVRLLTVQHRPLRAPVAAALLFPGLSHAMCDIDYFMSKLARELAELGFFVIQVDPRGHGDSPGEFADVDLDSLRRDIRVAVARAAESYANNMLCVGRGLLATLLAELPASRVTSVAGVSPYTLEPGFVGAYFSAGSAAFVGAAPDSAPGAAPGFGGGADAGDLLPGTKYPDLSDFTTPAIRIIHALGALAYNLHGLRLGAGLLEGLARFDPRAVLREREADAGLWLGGSADASEIFAGVSRGAPVDPSVHDRPSLPRDPAIQAGLIAQITQWARARAPEA